MPSQVPPSPFGAITDNSFLPLPVWRNWFNILARYVARSPVIAQGLVAPVTAPGKVGDIYVDTVLGKVYVAIGITNAADWKILN